MRLTTEFPFLFFAVDIQADRDGFDSLTAEEKLDYLLNREIEYENKCKRLLAEEAARAQWISNKRIKTVCLDSPMSRGGAQSPIHAEVEYTSEEDDMYEKPGIFERALYVEGDRSVQSLTCA